MKSIHETGFIQTSLKQGAEEWLAERKNCITGTDAGIILGVNTFGGNSPQKLWHQKLGLFEAEAENEKMKEGKDLEKDCFAYLKFDPEWSDFISNPDSLINDTYSWLFCSPDAICKEKKAIIEIKCGQASYEKAKAGKEVEDYYMSQVQHDLMTLGFNECILVNYRPGEEVIMRIIKRDNSYIDNLFKLEQEFYGFLQNKTAIPDFWPTHKVEEDQYLNDLALQVLEAKKQIRDLEKLAETAQKSIIEAIGKESYAFTKNHIKMNVSKPSRIVDWKAVQLAWSISDQDLESFKKERQGSVYFVEY